jgi:threonine dehydratase
MVVLTRPLFSFKNEALNKLLGSRFTFSNHMTGYERSKAAALLLKEIGANVTPLLRSATLDEKIGGRILIKAESTQLTGSFKFRGAYNKLRILSNNGVTSVITFSSGNHGSAVALAGKLLGITTTVVMPNDAPKVKVASTKAHGAQIVLYDRVTDDRNKIANDLASISGATFVHPFDDMDVMAGQGTIAIEIIQQLQSYEMNTQPLFDQILVCCSGGGLSAGIADVCSTLVPGVQIHTVEPQGFDKMKRSLAAGTRLSNEKLCGSLCDALLAPMPGVLPFAVLQQHASFGVSVSDDQVKDAMRLAFIHFRLVLEPGGAAALAGALSKDFRERLRGRTTVVIASGGNVDTALFTSIVNEPTSPDDIMSS